MLDGQSKNLHGRDWGSKASAQMLVSAPMEDLSKEKACWSIVLQDGQDAILSSPEVCAKNFLQRDDLMIRERLVSIEWNGRKLPKQSFHKCIKTPPFVRNRISSRLFHEWNDLKFVPSMLLLDRRSTWNERHHSYNQEARPHSSMAQEYQKSPPSFIHEKYCRDCGHELHTTHDDWAHYRLSQTSILEDLHIILLTYKS